MQNISSIDQNSKLGCEQTKKWLKTDLTLSRHLFENSGSFTQSTSLTWLLKRNLYQQATQCTVLINPWRK